MYFQETYTFKMRRKGDILIASLLLLNFVSGILAANHQSCPEHCECYVDLQYEYNWRTAACDRLVLNRTFFPAIVHLKLHRAPYADQCHLPNVTAKMFPNLQKLEMSNCSLTSIPSAGGNDFKNLHSLDVSYNLIRSVPSNALHSYQQMQHLNLANNPINPHSPPAIVSSSLYEISLDSCAIQNLSEETFAGTPNLKYLSLSNNDISLLHLHTFPDGLSTIDLSKNKIANIPLNEFGRLHNLAQINLSGNPVNCTCALVDFQDKLSGKAVLFTDGIQCAYPRKYAGRNLSHIPENELCDYGKFEDGSSSREHCAPNQICNNGFLADEGYLNDQDKDDNDLAMKQDEVMPVDPAVMKEDTEQLDGSGDGESTDAPIDPVKPESTSTTISPTEASPSPSPETATSSSSAGGVVKVEDELSSTSESSSSVNSSTDVLPTTVSETPATPSSESSTAGSALPETPQVSTENQTSTTSESNIPPVPAETESITTSDSKSTKTSAEIESTTVSDSGNTKISGETEATTASDSNSMTQLERLQKDKSHKEMYGYLIPGLAVLLIGLVCLAVYCSQCASKVDTYKQAETNVEGAELQEVSLLPDSDHPTIVKHSSKYPGEKENGQTERLMSDHERTNGGNCVVAEVNGNGSQHSDETIECCKLANGQSAAANQNALGNVECTVVRVTTLPDSVPKTAVIRDL